MSLSKSQSKCKTYEILLAIFISERGANMKNSKKIFMTLGCVIGALLIALVAYYLGQRNFFGKENANNTPIVDMSDPNGSTEYGKLYYSPIDETHIATTDEENAVLYIDNEVLIVVKEGTSRDEVVTLSEKYNAEIVGEIEITGDYQLRLSTSQSESELLQIVETMKSESVVESAIPNYVTQISESKKTEERNGFYYGKEWYKDLQNFNDVNGKSWGLEAIGTLGAWDKLTHTSRTINPVKVGVIDNGFDVNHEDLQFAEVFYDGGANGVTTVDKVHGTHVTGTIAADNSNTTGICGVYPYGTGNLYGISFEGVMHYSENGEYDKSTMWMKCAFAELVVRDVKVINTSFNNRRDRVNQIVSKSQGWENALKELEQNADVLGDFLNRLLNKGYDFCICSAAGNSSTSTTGHLDARYNSFLNAIDKNKYPDVYNRIIVVGAVDHQMNVATYSNGGNRVDIYAPGGSANMGVYSTLPNNKYDSKSGNDIMSGTSMAAPHVSGVAAMVWSANNSLTGAEVKEAITRRSNSRCTSCNMIDAYAAVSYALGEDDTNNKTTVENGGVLCYVVQKHSENIKISKATVTMKNINTNEVYTTQTDESGHFELMLPEGEYSLSVTADGYHDYIWPDDNNYQNPIVVKNNGINYLDDWIKMRVRDLRLSVFAMDSENLSPITNKEIEIILDNQEMNCTDAKQTISTTDGSVIFNIIVGEENKALNSKITLHIDGYKDFVINNFSFNNEPTYENMFDAIFEEEISNPANIEFVSADVSEYPRVKLYLRVTDPDSGESIENLLMNSFTVEERLKGGEYLSRTVKNAFSLEGNGGLKTALAADKSDSISDYDMDKIKSVMIEFVNNMDYNAGDEAMVIAFDSIVQTMCTFTNNRERLTHGIENMSTDGRTACYDAIYNAVQNASLRGGARCVIAFTDGYDNESIHTPEEVIYYANTMQVPLYIIGVGYGYDTYHLENMANSTNGRYWHIDNLYDLEVIFNAVYAEQKDLYVVEYESDAAVDADALRDVIVGMKGCGYKADLSTSFTPIISANTTHTTRYEVFADDVTWEEANALCIQKGGHLATITDAAEEQELIKLAESKGLSYVWLGGYTSFDSYNNVFAHWITGEEFAYQNWASGEPSRQDRDGVPEWYLMLWNVKSLGGWTWNDQRNDPMAEVDYMSGKIGYICEYE